MEEIRERIRRSYRRRWWSINRSQQQQGGAAATAAARDVPAALKTRVYKQGAMHSECMICLADFETGDRVGNLPCGHVFHVEPCLKEWLGRKNHCPLCHTGNLAVPTNTAPARSEMDTRTLSAFVQESEGPLFHGGGDEILDEILSQIRGGDHHHNHRHDRHHRHHDRHHHD